MGCTAHCSRGLHLRLDYDAMTAEVVREYFHPRSLQSIATGSYAALGSGNVLIGWGSQPAVTEFRGDAVVMDLQNAPLSPGERWGEIGPYRAFKMDWVGRPTWGPSIAFDGGTVYLSWNGATEVESWVVVSAAPRCKSVTKDTNAMSSTGLMRRMLLIRWGAVLWPGPSGVASRRGSSFRGRAGPAEVPACGGSGRVEY